jgi:predicted deacylase
MTTTTTSTTTTTTSPTTLPPAPSPAPTQPAQPTQPTQGPTVGGYPTPIPGAVPRLPLDPVPAGWTEIVIGTSAGGRPIPLYSLQRAAPTFRLLVICGIHGNEPLTVPFGYRLLGTAIPDHIECSVVPCANPDGWAADSRYNDVGADLNRDFPWEWAPYDGGVAPADMPETQALMAVVPLVDLVVWVHQPLGYVAAIGATPPRFAQAWSGATGLRVRPDVTQHGGGESWSALVAGVPSMLVEIDSFQATVEMLDVQQAGFAALLQAIG